MSGSVALNTKKDPPKTLTGSGVATNGTKEMKGTKSTEVPEALRDSFDKLKTSQTPEEAAKFAKEAVKKLDKPGTEDDKEVGAQVLQLLEQALDKAVESGKISEDDLKKLVTTAQQGSTQSQTTT